MNKFIVITGSPNDGFEYHGSFDTHSDANNWGLHYFSHSGFFISELKPSTKHYTITKEQFQAIEMGLQLGLYFVSDKPFNDQNKTDSESIESALKAFEQISRQEVKQ